MSKIPTVSLAVIKDGVVVDTYEDVVASDLDSDHFGPAINKWMRQTVARATKQSVRSALADMIVDKLFGELHDCTLVEGTPVNQQLITRLFNEYKEDMSKTVQSVLHTKLDPLKEHVLDKMPFGWGYREFSRLQGITDQQVVEWLSNLQRLMRDL